MALRERLERLERIVADKLVCQECSATVFVVVLPGEDPTPQLPGPCAACGRQPQTIIVKSPFRTRASYGATARDEDGPPRLPEIVAEEGIEEAGLAAPVIVPQDPSAEPPSAYRPADGLPRPPRWVPRHEIPPEQPAAAEDYEPLSERWR